MWGWVEKWWWWRRRRRRRTRNFGGSSNDGNTNLHLIQVCNVIQYPCHVQRVVPELQLLDPCSNVTKTHCIHSQSSTNVRSASIYIPSASPSLPSFSCNSASLFSRDDKLTESPPSRACTTPLQCALVEVCGCRIRGARRQCVRRQQAALWKQRRCSSSSIWFRHMARHLGRCGVMCDV